MNNEVSSAISQLKAANDELRAKLEVLERRLAARTQELAISNHRLDESRERFRVFAENVPELFSYVDADERYQFVNRGYEVLFRRPSREIVGGTIRELIGDEAYALAAPYVTAALSGEHVEYEAPFPLGERRRFMDVRYVPDRDDAGSVRGFFALVTDVTERRLAEREVQRSRDRLDAVVSSAADAIITVARDGTIESFNRAAERTFGYASEEIVGRNVSVLVPEPFRSEYRVYLRDHREPASAAWLGEDREAEAQRKDGSAFPVELAVSEAEGGKHFTAIVRDVSLRKKYREDLLRSREALRSLSARLIAAEENERRRISRELHDDFSQRLAMLAVDVEHLASAIPENPEASRRLKAVSDSLADLTDDMHRLAYTLHPSILDHLGLAAALRRYAGELAERHPLVVTVSERGFSNGLTAEASSCLYRVAQESLSNVVKHSGSPRVSVRLVGTRNAVRLSIRDSGKGFDVAAARRDKTLGLTSMEERARLLGGAFSIRSAPGGGTLVRVTCPRPGGKRPLIPGSPQFPLSEGSP